MADNYWKIPATSTLSPPANILKEQATALTAATNGMLQGAVSRSQSGGDSKLALLIIAKALNNYTYTLLTVEHGITLYPVAIFFLPTGIYVRANDEPAFRQALKDLIGSDESGRIVAGLLAQINN